MNAQSAFQSAEAARKGGNCRAALPLYARAVSADSKFVRAYLSEAACYQILNRIPDAESALTGALAADPRNLPAYMQRETLEAIEGQFGAATTDAETVARLAPSTPAGLTMVENAFEVARQYGDAERTEKAVIQQQPNDSRNYIRLGELQARQREFAEAHRSFQTALMKARDNSLRASAAFADAEAYSAQRDTKHAETAIAAALRFAPHDSKIEVLNGSILAATSQYKSAERSYASALRDARTNGETENARINLAALYARLGRNTESKKLYTAALQSNNDPVFQAVIQARIDKLK
jgi:tetratricopeptide (TPR) repeat protein